MDMPAVLVPAIVVVVLGPVVLAAITVVVVALVVHQYLILVLAVDQADHQLPFLLVKAGHLNLDSQTQLWRIAMRQEVGMLSIAQLYIHILLDLAEAALHIQLVAALMLVLAEILAVVPEITALPTACMLVLVVLAVAVVVAEELVFWVLAALVVLAVAVVVLQHHQALVVQQLFSSTLKEL